MYSRSAESCACAHPRVAHGPWKLSSLLGLGLGVRARVRVDLGLGPVEALLAVQGKAHTCE